MSDNEPRCCPHCGEPLKKWATPDFSTWVDDFHWVCFNDDCDYFQEGFDHMEETRGIRCSYRYMCGFKGQKTGPLSVPNEKMGRDMIRED